MNTLMQFPLLWDYSYIFHTHTLTHIHKSSAVVAPDVKAVTGDLQLLGEGLVKSVEVLCDPPAVNGDTF